MNSVPYIFRRLAAVFAFIMISIAAAMGQKPEIKSIDKVTGSMEELVTIQGSFFGTNINNIAVTFGASRGTVLFVTDQLLVAAVPPGTTYNTVAVTNLTNGLTGFTNQFLLNFRGSAGFDVAKLQGQFDFPAGAPTKEGLYDLCMCDFDGDRKVDVATANDNTAFVNIFPNASTPGTIAFPSKIALNIASRSLHIKCGDLNGDGKPDLIATESGTTDKVFILKNNSTGAGSFAFSAPLTITLAGKRPKRIEIGDLDLDGKPEVVLTSQGNNSVTVLVNQSTLGSISFSPVPPISIVIPGAASTEGLAVEDLNGDSRPEIITSQFQTNSDIYVISNVSSPGSFAAGAIRTITVGTPIKNIRVGDLDGDRKPDIAYTKLTSSEVGLILNQSTSTAFNFTSAPSVATDVTPWGIDFGDLDGDGKADIVIASITRKSITILNNTSVPGSLSFNRFVHPTTYINRHINLCDVDTDGKPDIVFTSIDDNNLNIVASKVSIFRNRTCLIPQVLPPGPLDACSGLALELVATKGGGVTYEWTNTTTSTTVAATNRYTPTVSGDYFVTAISEGGNCKEVSNSVKVTISPGTALDPAPVNNGPVCIGETLNLQISNNLGAGYTYHWTGPDNYQSTGLNPAPITNFQLRNAGIYTVDVRTSSGCVARKEGTLVQAVDLPDFNVSFTGSAFICQPDFKSLSVYPVVPGFTYQWFEKTSGMIAGATGTTLLRSTSGEYYYEATSSNPGCPVKTSKSAILTVVAPPVAAFTLPATACRGQEVSFVNQSTSDPSATASYLWNFGDGQTSPAQNPTHIYSSAAAYTVSLTVSYPSNACLVTTTRTITITDAPAVSIITADDTFEVCPGGSLVLGVSATFSYYLWSTGATTSSITVSTAGEYSVEVTASNGCELKAIQRVAALPAPVVTVSATPDQINEGESSQLSASGLLSYSWLPAETLSAPDQAEPVATPLTSTTYTVTGVDANGCEGQATIDLRVIGESTVSKLGPSNFFSPNGDAVGQYWLIERIEDYPQCTITIYDDKGVKVYDAKPYENNWAGTYNGGKQLPDGVYYYIIRCDGEENMPRTGSITLLR